MGKGRAIWLAASTSKPGKDAEYNKWYDAHIDMLFKFKAIKRVCRYHCLQKTDASNPKLSKYLVFFEFDSKKDLATYPKSFGPTGATYEATKDFEKNFAPIGEINWAGCYEPLKLLEREARKDSVYRIVATECKPEKEAEYNHWYSETHLPMLFGFEGVKRASRYRCYKDLGGAKVDCVKFLAIYEFGTKEEEVAFNKSPAMAAAIVDWDDKIKNSGWGIKVGWSAPYEPLKWLDR
jgi:hypothetical protein